MKSVQRIISMILALSLILEFCPQAALATETEQTQETEIAVTATETTAPAELVTEPVEETATPTEAVTEPVEETAAPTETVIIDAQLQEVVSSPDVLASVTSGTCGKNLTWELDSNGSLCIDGTGPMDSYYYGSTPWFDLRKKINEVFISEGVTTISKTAFSECVNLYAAHLPSTLTSLGNEAFEYCASLKEIDIPIGVSKIGLQTFYDCTNLIKVSIPEGVTSIGQSAFEGCTALENIILPSTVTSFGSSVFTNCTNLASINIPEGVKAISTWMFSNCKSLKNITLPDSLTGIGLRAFSSCTSLESIVIPSGVSFIDENTFSGCSNLQSVSLSEGLKSIYKYAFSSCSSLKNIVLPESLTSIGDSVFKNCTSLTSIVIPDGITSLSWSLFSDCTSLTHVTLSKNLKGVQGYGVFKNCQSLKSITIPDGVTGIYEYTFSGCKSLVNVILPKKLEYISQCAFSGCTSLSSITIPEGTTSLAHAAFSSCSSLAEIIIPKSLTSIDSSVFSECNALKDVYYTGTEAQWKNLLTATKTYGNSPLFSNSLTVHFDWTGELPGFPDDTATKGTCGDNLTWNLDTETGILTISGTGDMYDYTAGTAPWYADFGDKISTLVIEEGATSIGSFAFYRCRSLENVTIAGTVTAIGSDAFYYCGGLKKITLPVSITHIGDRAFSACTGLTNFNVPTRTTTIGSQAFAYTNLKTITIPGTVTSLGQDAFLDSTALTDVYFDGYLSSWDSLGVTLPEGTALSYVYTDQQKAWIEAHMDYIDSEKYATDIVGGYNNWMLYLFREARDDGNLKAFDLAESVSKALELNFTLSGIETYEVLLSQILYDRTALNAAYATYEEGLCGAITYLAGIYKDWANAADDTSDFSKEVRTKINELYSIIIDSSSSTSDVADAHKQMVSLVGDNITWSSLKQKFKKSNFDKMGIVTDLLFELYDTLEDITCYIENYMAYQYTSRYFKTALQALAVTIYERYGSENGFLDTNPFNELGGIDAQINWLELNTALYNFIDELDAYEQEGADSIGRYAVERAIAAGENLAVSSIRSTFAKAIETIISQIPVVKLLYIGKYVADIGTLCAKLLTNVDDRKAALDMMAKVYCMSVMLDESIETCAGSVDYSNYEASMVFDESVQIYACTQKIGWKYAQKYAQLRLANAIEDLEDYTEDNDNVKEKKLRKLNYEVNRFLGYLTLLESQLYDLNHIACHDASVQYVEDPADNSADFSDARAFVVACPVSVTVTDPQGNQMALLTDNGSQVKEGYELYFHTIPLNDDSGQHIKVAIAPKDYTVTVDGTDEGEMNAFVKDCADASNTVSMYLDVPVKKGSKGSFRNVSGKQEPVLTMDDANHEPLVSGPEPGDVNLDGSITVDDAIYLLWNTLFPDLYPVTVNADFDGNGIRNSDDAVVLLWQATFPEPDLLS